MNQHFAEIAVVTDVIASAILVLRDVLHHAEGFEDRAGVLFFGADVVKPLPRPMR
jgi:hypothetical protein